MKPCDISDRIMASDFSQHWFRYGLAPNWCQAITWNNVNNLSTWISGTLKKTLKNIIIFIHENA